MHPGMALVVTLRGSNYRCLEQIFMVQKGFEPSKFDCIYMRCCAEAVHVNGEHSLCMKVMEWILLYSIIFSIPANPGF